MAAHSGADDLGRFSGDLRQLREKSGLSIRALAKIANYSRTALAEAAGGRSLPSWMVVRAYVTACGGNVDDWEHRWRALSFTLRGSSHVAVVPAPPWPAEPVVDGADPESAGCTPDAVTVLSRKIALVGTRHIVGIVELRYSARNRAAWGRFEGFAGLDHWATHKHEVVIDVGVQRDDRTHGVHFVARYSFDHHYSGLLCTNGRALWATVEIFFDGERVAASSSERIALA